MPLERTKNLYLRTCKDNVFLRRFTGTGDSRTPADFPARAALRSGSIDKLVVGNVSQYEYLVILYAQDLVDQGIAEVRSNDMIVVDGNAYGITFPDGFARRDEGVIVAWVLHLRGR